MAWCGVVVREEKKVPPGEERPVTALLPLLSLSRSRVFLLYFSLCRRRRRTVSYHPVVSCRAASAKVSVSLSPSVKCSAARCVKLTLDVDELLTVIVSCMYVTVGKKVPLR